MLTMTEMNWGALCDFVDKHRNSIPPEAPIYSAGHYGEPDSDLWDLIYHDAEDARKRSNMVSHLGREAKIVKRYGWVELFGMPAGYPEPD